MPVPDPRRHEQPASARECLADQVLSGGILPAPGTPVHPVVHALVAVGADVLELVVAPLLGPAAPGAVAHRIHDAAAAAPAAAAVELESLRRLERHGARVPVGDVAPAPRAMGEAVRDDPAAVVTLGPGLPRDVPPLEPLPDVPGGARPEPIELRPAR